MAVGVHATTAMGDVANLVFALGDIAYLVDAMADDGHALRFSRTVRSIKKLKNSDNSLMEIKNKDGLKTIMKFTTYDGNQGYMPLFHEESSNSIQIHNPLSLMRF